MTCFLNLGGQAFRSKGMQLSADASAQAGVSASVSLSTSFGADASFGDGCVGVALQCGLWWAAVCAWMTWTRRCTSSSLPYYSPVFFVGRLMGIGGGVQGTLGMSCSMKSLVDMNVSCCSGVGGLALGVCGGGGLLDAACRCK